jgi:4-amino-4-deoxy-L-arabinose transferase-like glycosyltransferase
MFRARPERPVAVRIATWTVFGAVVATAATRLCLAWTSVAILVEKSLPDDAFYYFQIARHLAQGDGVTFDGLTATNGFHPLWLVLITPFFYLFPGNPELPIHLALALSTLLSLATLLFVYAMTTQLTGDRFAAALAVALYAFNPWVILESLNGLETAVANLCFAAMAWYYLACDNVWDNRRALTLGLLAGLTALARTDNVLLFVVLLLALRAGRTPRAWVRLVLIAGVTASVVVMPWVLWSAFRAGSPIQSSGLAVPFVIRGNIVPALGTDSLARWIVGQTLEGIRLALSYSGTPWPPLPFVLAVVALAVSDYKKDFALRRQLGQLNFMAAVLLALVLFHSSYRLYPRGWYFVPVAFLSALYLGVLLASLRRAAPRRSTTIASAVVVLAIAGINVLGFGIRWRTGLYPWQSEMLTAARWLGEHTDPSAKIGAFNAGIPAYWNPERTVINLDGVVNTDAFTAIRHRRLWAYIDHAQLTYVLDYQPYWLASPAEFSNAYGPYLGVSLPEHVSLVATIPGTRAASDIVIMKTKASRLIPEPALGIK